MSHYHYPVRSYYCGNYFFPGGNHYYGVRIVNGSMKAAGTTGADVFVTLVGSKASTGKVSINSYLFHVFSGITADTVEDLIIETTKSLGDIQVVLLGIDGGEWALDNTWFVNYTDVKDLTTNAELRFPCYHWIGKNEVVSTTSKASKCKCLSRGPVIPDTYNAIRH